MHDLKEISIQNERHMEDFVDCDSFSHHTGRSKLFGKPEQSTNSRQMVCRSDGPSCSLSWNKRRAEERALDTQIRPYQPKERKPVG